MTLAALSAANNLPEVHIYADSVDESRLREMEIVRDLYLPEAFLFHAKPHVSVESGTWNILQSIRNAGKWADEVYLVEEDVLVYPYFFDWHATQLSDISCGRRMPRHPDFKYYTNPGSRLSRKALDAIIPHINREYFQNTQRYCDKEFPEMIFLSSLDDGLIRRVVERNQLTVTFPESPVCAHVGIPLLDKLDIYKVEGNTLMERIESVKKIVAAPKEAARYAPLWEPYSPRVNVSPYESPQSCSGTRELP